MSVEKTHGGEARSRVYTVLRVAAAASLLLWLVVHVGVNQIRDQVRDLRPALLVLPVLLTLVDSAVRAEAWRRLLRLHGVAVPFGAVLHSHLVGNVFGAFVPSSLGTDLGRVLALSRRGGVAAMSSVSSMLGVNVLNLLAVCVLSSAIAFHTSHAGWFAPLRMAVIVFSLAYATALALALSPLSPLPRLRSALPVRGVLGRISARLAEIAEALHDLRRHPSELVRLFVLGLSSQTISVLVVYATGRAVGADTGLSAYFFVVPILTLVRLIPMSVAGLGGDQAGFVLLFGSVSMPAAQALVLSLTVAAVTGIHTLLSGVVAVASSASGSGRRPA